MLHLRVHHAKYVKSWLHKEVTRLNMIIPRWCAMSFVAPYPILHGKSKFMGFLFSTKIKWSFMLRQRLHHAKYVTYHDYTKKRQDWTWSFRGSVQWVLQPLIQYCMPSQNSSSCQCPKEGSFLVVTSDLDSSSYNSHVSYNSQLEYWSALHYRILVES